MKPRASAAQVRAGKVNGGKARAAKLSPERRRQIARLGALAKQRQWEVRMGFRDAE